MTSSDSSGGRRARAVRLTAQAFEALENALMQWWEASEEKQDNPAQKLTREKKAEKLALDKKTWDSIRALKSVDRGTLQHAFGQMGLHWKEEYCLPVGPEEAATPQPQGSVPGLPALLLGRETTLRELRQRLCPDANAPAGSSAQRIVVVRGWPGVGKTTLTAAMAHDGAVRNACPDGTLWTSLGTEPDIRATLAAWGRQLGAEQIGRAGSLEEASAQLAALLRDRRFLLIIDDVWQAEAARLLLVGGRECAALITTRDKGVAQSLAPRAEDVYRLAELEPEFAIELLQALAPAVVAQHRDACVELCRELENLPLALQVAGRLLHREAETGLEVAGLLAELREGTRLLEQKPPPDRLELMRETTPTVAVLLQKSTDRLDAHTRECFALLGPFAPKPATFELAALRYMWELDDPAPVVRTLVERGLLETAGPGRYQMHALLVTHACSLLQE